MPAKSGPTNAQIQKAHQLLANATASRPITSEQIGAALGIDDIEGNWNAREVVHQVMLKKRVPVVASPSGYYVPTSYDEVKAYKDDLQRRALAIMGRAALVDSLWHEAHGDEGPGTPSIEEEW